MDKQLELKFLEYLWLHLWLDRLDYISPAQQVEEIEKVLLVICDVGGMMKAETEATVVNLLTNAKSILTKKPEPKKKD